ncbi:trypsin-like peptidase domain-containing protein [Psychromarinibacter sp. C21-152]|uniref:Trypsin-like peptidase domain-containing protein n=1 Tax=Psychromarinibacter sediminicola TaxID=3033385 RepID=A0AAE3NYJ8_9RHOB|nr:trypsin-like peptidase domain-containing protein [Psychromarinibacter sediminicola]MDF0603047.1 trypsin-like peptidase domain-containing protein [Psychromarinibacter sediminicola]
MRDRLVFLLAGLALGAAALFWYEASTAPPPEPRTITPRGELSPSEETVIALFEATQGSVVSITTRAEMFDPFSRRRQVVPRGSGSGFLWDDAGHVVTNNHVIEGASGAQVRLADGQVVPARLVGRDPSHDLAVLRIDPDGPLPPPIPLGESAGIRVGQTVLAIGNPFGLDWTLTTGVVSALDREIDGQNGQTITGLIQTDAAINPGNSGGPLIDSAGRLIGVNTAILSPSGSSAGIGLAVPVDVVNRVVPQLIATGRYRPPVLGVVHDERVNALARRQGIEGVLVLGVEPGTPASTAGLRPATADRAGRITPGDVIVGLDDRAIGGSADLAQALDRHRPGDTVKLRVRRNGAERVVEITLASG